MLLFSPSALEYPIPATEFEKQVFDFCQKWKKGQAHFHFMTSGSTGSPKPIQISREAMIASAKVTGEWLQLKPNDVALVCLPIHYIAGSMVLVRALELNLQLLLIEPCINPLKDLPPISIQLASFVPNQWYAILNDGIDLLSYFSKSKAVLLGGAALNLTIISQTNFQFPIFATYGMTETVSHVAYQMLSPTPATCYKILPSIEFEVGINKCARFKGDVTGQQWVQTNDIVEQIDSCHFKVLGRADRVINSAGRKIQAEKVEQEIASLFSERSFFVSGVPNEVVGQKAVLFIEGLGLVDESLVNQKSLPALQSWEIPKQVVYLPKFETTESGKIDRLKSVALYLNKQK